MHVRTTSIVILTVHTYRSVYKYTITSQTSDTGIPSATISMEDGYEAGTFTLSNPLSSCVLTTTYMYCVTADSTNTWYILQGMYVFSMDRKGVAERGVERRANSHVQHTVDRSDFTKQSIVQSTRELIAYILYMPCTRAQKY